VIPAPPASRILVVDDNHAIHEDFRKIFGASRPRTASSVAERALFGDGEQAEDGPDFQLDFASQGEDGLALVQQALEQDRPYAMAFIDVRMPPGWDGIETTAKIWEHDSDIQVVICTAYSDYSWTEMLARLGRSDRLVILKKPFDTIEVLQLASALTEKWRLARQSRWLFEGMESRIAERTRDLVQIGDRLQQSESQYRMLFEHNPHPMWVYDLATLRFVAVNAAAAAHYGYTAEEFLAMTIRDIRPAEDLEALEMSVRDLQSLGKTYGEWRHRKRDGSLMQMEITSDRIVFNYQPSRLVLAHDVTARKEAEAGVKRLNRVYAVLSGINTLIVRVRDREQLFDSACRLVVATGGFVMALIGVVDARSAMIVPVASSGKTPEIVAALSRLTSSRALASATMVARAIRDKRPVVSNDSRGDPEVLLGAAYAEAGVRSMAILPLIVGEEAVGALALYAAEKDFFRDDEMKLLTELADDVAFAIDHIDKRERLDYLAYYDELTGLANRSLFLERVAQHMRAATAGGHQMAVFLLDIERFNNINDSLGRGAGDALLKQAADCLTLDAGDASLVARIEGDHFAIALPVVRQGGNVAHLLEKMVGKLVNHPFRLNDAVFRIAAKAGVALFPDDGADADTLFRNAQAALKKAKAGGERYLFYNRKMTATLAGKLTLENQLRRALEKDEFALHYEPKFCAASGRLAGAEALIRWNDPRSGLVAPGRFIPILEETGLIHEVGRWALRKAAEDYLRWRAAGLPAVRISVNVSPLQLRNRAFIAEIEQAVGGDARSPAGLELEITESLIMADIKHSIATLKSIRAMGVTVAIDDFGTGFSSLSYLSKLPVDTLKIDRSFVVEMTVGPQGLGLVSTIINLAHSLKLNVVAEGVETEEQARLLRLLSCDELQGYLYSRALPSAVFESKFLALPAAA
jgi:diguanylate cyclase (GGDEF)-like protein/PAS domain S-box-containing protein